MEIDSRLTGKTRLLGVIGNPIEHSISPQLHNTISRHMGLDLVYVPFKVEKHSLQNAINGLKALNIIGFNITIPYKNDVIQFLDEITQQALLVGAVNTVKNVEGKLYGYNTDADGFARSFKEESGIGFEDKKIVMLGAGGAARSMAVKMALEGAKSIYIVNRTVSKADEIAEVVNKSIRNIASSCSSHDLNVIAESDIIINTTSLGMYPDVEGIPIGESVKLSGHQVVYDVIYNPMRTKFLINAEKSGCKTINGLGMLFYQGVYAYELWTDIKIPQEVLKQVYTSFRGILKV